MQLTPYLNFSGNCEEAFKFYEQCLGGKIVAMIVHASTPAEALVPPERRDKIMHARLQVGDATLMGSDNPPEYAKAMQGMYVFLNTENTAEAERVFHALAEGGDIKMPIEETFWALRFGIVVDRFGTPWMVNCQNAG